MYYFKTNTDVPLEFISAGQFVSNREWVHSKRNLDSYVAIVGVDETLYIAQESEQYEVKPGDVLFLLPNHVHWGYKPCQSGLSYYWFHFYCPRNVQFIEASTIHREVKEMRSNPYPLEKKQYGHLYSRLLDPKTCRENSDLVYTAIGHLESQLL